MTEPNIDAIDRALPQEQPWAFKEFFYDLRDDHFVILDGEAWDRLKDILRPILTDLAAEIEERAQQGKYKAMMEALRRRDRAEARLAAVEGLRDDLKASFIGEIEYAEIISRLDKALARGEGGSDES